MDKIIAKVIVLLERAGSRSRPAAFIRGGNWDNGANAGVFALNLNNAPSNSNNNIGFRCCNSFPPTGEARIHSSKEEWTVLLGTTFDLLSRLKKPNTKKSGCR